MSYFNLGHLLPPANEVCEGYVFTGVCLSTRGACMVAPGGGMHGCSRGHAWLLWGGMCGCPLQGIHGCSPGGHAWLLWGACVVVWGGVRGCSGGMCGCSWGCGCSGGLHGCSRGACTVAPGGGAWLLPGGACVVFSMRYGQ